MRARSGRAPGLDNQLGLLKLALGAAGVQGLTVPDPTPALDFGYYYPSAERPAAACSRTGTSFDAWRRANGKPGPAPRASRSASTNPATTPATPQLLDAVIAEVERQGAEAIPLFGYPERCRVRAAVAR